MIECPFCISEIDPEAVACKSCGRDLAGHMYLLRRIAALDAAVCALRIQISATSSEPSLTAAKLSAPIATDGLQVGRVDIISSLSDIALFLLIPDFLLVLGHHLFVFSWNLGPAWLFALTLLLPAFFGFGALIRGSRGFAFWMIAFLINAVVIVLAMSLDTSLSTLGPHSDASLVPTTPGEWGEDLQFSSGLYLSFLAGSFAAIILLRLRYPDHPALARSRSGFQLLAQRLRIAISAEFVERVGKYVTSVGALASAAGALYLGLQRL